MSDLNNMQPIIILGAGRSGTKFFRDTLLFSDMTCAVPYDINYIWRYGNERCEHDELTVDMITDSSREYIRKSIARLASLQNNSAQFLLEKTVSNGLRVDFINEIFPEAKFIHLIRDGRAVTESSVRMWNAPPETSYLLKKLKYFPWRNYQYAITYLTNFIYGFFKSNRGQKIWGPRYDGIQQDIDNLPLLDICAIQWEQCVSKALDSLNHIPAERVLTIKYEDFVSSTNALSKAVDFIGLQGAEQLIANYEKKLRFENIDKWKDRFTEAEVAALNQRLSSTLVKLGYI